MAKLHYSPQLRKAIWRRRNRKSPVDGVMGRNSQQFGQSADGLVGNGATACTDTVLQWLIFLWKGKWVTLNDIRRVSGGPTSGDKGLTAPQVQKVINAYGLPYRIAYDLSAKQVRDASKLGPVGFGHRYSWWPDWKGYRNGGVASDGKPNGYAQPLGKAGHTQKTWDGAHFGLLLGVATSPDLPDKVYAWEPNHGSPARPEKPDYDIMSVAQFDRVYNSYKKSLGRRAYAIVPTQLLPAKGY